MAIKTTPRPHFQEFDPAAQRPRRPPLQATQEEIAARAFEIYQRDGGNDHENWLRASAS